MASLYDNGNSYSSINAYKSAIGQTLASMGNHLVNDSELIPRFMKGLFNLRPPLPKYTFTWEVEKVLNYLSSLFPLESIDLKLLTLKVTALMALATAQRVQTLNSLNMNNIEIHENRVTFWIESLQKTDRLGHIRNKISIFAYRKAEICPVFTLKFYLNAVENKRVGDNILVSFKTFRNVSTSTLSRWLKNVLSLAGIDINKFQAHSYRGAASSSAFQSGITLKDILKTANWKSARTFKKFYLRDVENLSENEDNTGQSFANAVLSS